MGILIHNVGAQKPLLFPAAIASSHKGNRIAKYVERGYLLSVTNDIRNRLSATPFLPFVVHTAGGREYQVPTADHAHVYPSGGRVSIYTDDDNEFILPALLISGIKIGSNGRKEA